MTGHLLVVEGILNFFSAVLSAVSPFVGESGKWCTVAASACSFLVVLRLIHHVRGEAERKPLERVEVTKLVRRALPAATEVQHKLDTRSVMAAVSAIGAAPAEP